MCSSAAGDKMPVFCVVPRKKQISNLELDDNLIILNETRGFFDANNLIEHYVERILKLHLLKNQIKNSDGLILKNKTIHLRNDDDNFNDVFDAHNREDDTDQKDDGVNQESESWESESEEEFSDSDCTINENINVENLDQTKQIVHNMYLSISTTSDSRAPSPVKSTRQSALSRTPELKASRRSRPTASRKIDKTVCFQFNT
ncbi:hypothetical protein BpHYR1_044157 [Brachionus plicatilis]|uniref:Uncharacterized protein n=1 Tax=Brachionus plicatilis TaxID=10195 RepID=A0A3M7T1D7_BRAPC|nr:hypothetical protein BpHYR1_044157 [Brachionus plicatilis]